MEVQLYVYDLSKGLARMMSMGLVGIQIDAVYHTSIVLGGVEYFYGAGVQTCVPGQTHHGRPMEVVKLGKTELPMDVVLSYLESLKELYTHESYDLFTHNCNNFSHDFSMFLLGKGIPEHITNLPSQVLNTPFGSMMKDQLDASMRHVTQAPVPPEKNPVVQAEAAAARKERARDNGGSPRVAKTDAARAALVNAVQQSSSAVPAAQRQAQQPSGIPQDKSQKASTPNSSPEQNKSIGRQNSVKHPRKLEVRNGGSEDTNTSNSSAGESAPPKKHPRKLEVRDDQKVADAHGSVRNVTQLPVLDNLLAAAKDTCCVLFFTSSTCAPCRLAYPTYDTLAADFPKVAFIKIDTNQARDIALKYHIRATPTFVTLLHGKKLNEWSSASPSQLRSNVELLIQQAFPQHPHLVVRVPTVQFGSLKPVTFTRIPPLDKLIAKMGERAKEPAIDEAKTFLTARVSDSAKEAPLPDLPAIARFLRFAPNTLPVGNLFTAYDICRCILLDPRVSGWFAEESAPGDSETITFLLAHVLRLINEDTCPYNLRLTAIQMASNLFISPLFSKTVMKSPSQVPTLMARLASESLLAEPDKPAIRSAASSLAFNLSATNYRIRREEHHEGLPESAQIELAASLLELLSTETQQDKEKGKEKEVNVELSRIALTAFAYLIYCAPRGGELADLCGALDAKGTVKGVKKVKAIEGLAGEIETLLSKEW